MLSVFKMTPIISWLFLCLSSVVAVKVVVIPQNINSHIMYHGRMARSLADEGHVVGFLLPSNAKSPGVLKNSSVLVTRYAVTREIPFMSTEEGSQLMVDYAMADTVWKQMNVMTQMNAKMTKHFKEECLALLNDDGVNQHMNEMGYDIAVMDNAGLSCHVALPYNRKIPIILYGVLSMEWLLRVPTLPSFVPTLLSQFSDEMTFGERLKNALIYIVGHLAIRLNNNMIPMSEPPVGTIEVIEKSIFYFALDDMSIAYPRPLMPNVLFVGDIVPQPGQALSPDMSDFVASAKQGVIIVSFGSFFDFVPPDVADKFCEAFKKIPQKVIWKLKNKDLCPSDASKILLVDWIPQNDLLSHSNVKLFISHCGMNSVLESIYQSTPILGFPLAIDQPYNAVRVQSRGFGYTMNIQDFSEAEIITKISDIINNETITENVRRASRIMRHKPGTAAKRASYWVEHLVQHGDKHVRTNALKLNMFQFYCLDVIIVILLCITLIFIITCVCVRSFFRCTKRFCCSRKAKID